MLNVSKLDALSDLVSQCPLSVVINYKQVCRKMNDFIENELNDF